MPDLRSDVPKGEFKRYFTLKRTFLSEKAEKRLRVKIFFRGGRESRIRRSYPFFRPVGCAILKRAAVEHLRFVDDQLGDLRAEKGTFLLREVAPFKWNVANLWPGWPVTMHASLWKRAFFDDKRAASFPNISYLKQETALLKQKLLGTARPPAARSKQITGNLPFAAPPSPPSLRARQR